MLNKIACSYYNAAAIAENEDLYLWGSIQSGLLGKDQTKPQEIPKKFSFDEVNLHFKALQVSVAPNHIAVVVGNKFLDKVEVGKYIDPMYKAILLKQADAFKKQAEALKKQANGLKNIPTDPIVKFNLSKNMIISRDEFIKTLHELSDECDYTREEEEHLPAFVDYFCMQNESHVNFVQYVYALSPESFATDKVLTWGFDDNGRLGHGDGPGADGMLLPEMILEQDEEEEEDAIQERLTKTVQEVKEKPKTSNDPQNILSIKYKPPKVVNIANPVKKVACGQKFTMALDHSGNIWTWGKGSNGCLGTGALNDVYKPEMIPDTAFGKIKTEHTIIDIAAGSEHCLALNQERNVFAWGNGKMGRLGLGSETSQLLPTKIKYFENNDIKIFRIEAGEMHSACISDEKFEIYTFGNGANYRLGHGSAANETLPRLVSTISDYYVCQISCGLQHTLCLTTDGYLYAWGCGSNGRLGVDMVSEKDYLVPTRVGIVNDEFKKKNFVEVFAGPYQSFALTREGELLSWGAKKFKTLGISDVKRDVYFPVTLNLGLIKFYNNTQALNAQEEAKKINFNSYDLEFQEFLDADEEPFQVARVFSGETNTVFLMANGDIYVTGSGQYGQLCLNPDIRKEDLIKERKLDPNLFWEENLFYSHAPMYIAINLEVKFKYVAVGLHHIVAISSAGKAYSWGRNTEGQLGLGNVSKFVCAPTVIEELALKEFVMCIASHTYSAFLAQDGQISVCGTAEYGCLGVNEIKQNYDVLIPKLVNDIPPVKFISGGPQHMVAITASGEIYAWGNTNNGRTGLNCNIERVLTPRQVVFDNKHQVKFVQVACGFMHTLLLDEEKRIWGAGVKAYAGFPSDDGYRTLEEQSTFSLLPDIMKMKFLHISAGEFHNLAVTEEREVYGWGKSEYGKLAQNTFLSFGSPDAKLKNILLPKKIDTLTDIEYVSCGVNHSTALKLDGDVHVWGCVLTGRLGIRTEELKFLKRQNQLKREYNVLTLNQPKKLLTYFDEEFESKVDQFAQNNMQDFMNVSPQGQRKAEKINKALKNENKEMENAPADFLADEYHEDGDPVTPKTNLILKKQFTMASPTVHDKFGNFSATAADYVTTSDPVTAVTYNASKKSESPERVDNEDSPLLSGINQRDTLERGRTHLTANPSRFSQASGLQSSPDALVEERQSVRSTKPKGGLPNINEKNSKFESSTSRTETTKQNYMTLVSENMNEKSEQLLLQRLLQEEESENYELTLMARDVELSQSFDLLFRKIGEEVEKVRNKLSNEAVEVESLINMSLSELPKTTRKIKNLAHTVPTFILQNIQIYEGIISMFYIHPCYLHKILKSDLIDANVVLDWVFKIYGSHKEDDRSINQALSLAIMVLEEEVETFPINQQSVVKLMSNFVKLYDFIQMSQQENVKFLREIAEHLLLNVVIQENHPAFNASARQKTSKFVVGMNNKIEVETKGPVQEDIENFFNLEPYIKNQKAPHGERFKLILKRCLDFIEKMEIYLKNLLARPDFSVLGKISPQMRYFNSRILEEYKNISIRKVHKEDKVKKSDAIDTAGIVRRTEFFVIELFFGKLSKIILEYKDHGIIIPSEYERILSPQNLSNLAMMISKYLQKEEVGQKLETQKEHPFAEINEFINTHSRGTQIVNNLMRGLTGHDDYNITLDNILRTLEDSIRIEDRINCKLSVKDIINIQNFLIKNRENPNIFIKEIMDKPKENAKEKEEDKDVKDPVYIMVDYLKENQRELNSFAFEMLDYKVNLKINSKIMRKAPYDPELKLYRCNYCQLVYPKDILRKEDTSLIYEKVWECHKCPEKTKNPFTTQNCTKCGSLIQEYKLQRKYIFKRYIPLIKKDQPLLDYFELLKTHPAIYIDQKQTIMAFLDEKTKAAAKAGRYDQSSMLSKIVQRFRTSAANLHTLAKEYKFSVGDIADEAKVVGFLHDLFCDEFQIRRLHKRFLDQLQSVLSRAYQSLAAGRHGSNRLLEAMEAISVKVAVSNSKYNGLVSKVLQKADSKEEEEMKIKLQSDTCKPYAMFNSVDMRNQRVLAGFVLHGKTVPKIVNNLKFYVFYRKNEGFTVKVVFIEDSWQNLLVRFGPWFINEVAVDEFQIPSEHFLELSRTVNYKAETTLGYSTFYVENLVKLLTDVLAKNHARKTKRVAAESQ